MLYESRQAKVKHYRKEKKDESHNICLQSRISDYFDHSWMEFLNPKSVNRIIIFWSRKTPGTVGELNIFLNRFSRIELSLGVIVGQYCSLFL